MRFLSQISSLAIFVLLCSSTSLGDENSVEEKNDDDYLIKIVWNCAKKGEIEICLKAKAARYLDKILKTEEPLAITDYLYLTRSSRALDYDATKTEEVEIQPWDNDNQISGKLDKIIWNKLGSLYHTKALKLAFPNDSFEGRQKIKGNKVFKKGGGYLIMAGMMGGMMLKMAMAKIALIAGKALIVAKIALILSLIIALKKLVSHGHSGGQSEVVYTTSEHGGGGWQRQFNVNPVWRENGARLAYQAYEPLDTKYSTNPTTFYNKDNAIS